MTELSNRFSFDPKAKQIIVHAGKVEIGQHIHHAFKMIVAQALRINSSRVRLSAITTALSPNDGMTVGSQSMQVTGSKLQHAALSLRSSLLTEASKKLDSDIDTVTLDPDTLEVSAGGKRCSIFDLKAAKNNVVKAQNDESNFSSIIADSIVGAQQYIQDLVLPGMIHARALRGREYTLGESQKVWVTTIGGFSALVAENEVSLDVAWAQTKTAPASRATRCDGPVVDWIKQQRVESHSSGHVSALKSSSIKRAPVTQTATRPFLLHASIAPSCAVARFSRGVLEIWTHSQGIFPLRDTIATYLGMQNNDVIVHHLPSAGCYGHSAADDAAMDAVMVCLQNESVPVRVAWTRYDEFRYSPVGAAMHVEVAAELSDDNTISSWKQTIWSCPHAQRPGSGGHINLNAAVEENSNNASKNVIDLPDSIGSGAARNATPPYSIKSFGVTTHIVQDLPLRTSSIRGLGAQMNVVCIEAMMDKLAETCAEDPLEFRLKQLEDPRGCEVLNQLRTALNDTTISLQENEAIGIAYSRYKEKAAYAAVAARVRLTDKVELADMWSVVDAGQILDRSGALNQIEGGIIQAASWTLCEGVLLRNGYIDAVSWDDYPVLGWPDIPQIHATLVGEQSGLPYLGVGECMVGPVSAAIVNGVSRVAGCSMADLPLISEKFLQAATNA